MISLLTVSFALDLSDPDFDPEETLLQRDLVPLQTLVTRCDAGEVVDCHRLGRRYEQGFGGAPVSFADAGRRFGAACDGGLTFSCGLAAAAFARSDEARGAEFARKGCDAGDPGACAMLGHFELVGIGAPQDVKSALARLEAGCSAGLPFACNELGVVLAGAVPAVPADPGRARPMLETSCTAGDGMACVWLGTLLLQGKGGPADPPRALGLLQTACDASDRGACESLAAAWIDGIGVQADPRKSVPFLRRACDLGSGMACGHLAGFTIQGQAGLTADRAQGVVLLGKACQHGLPPACTELQGACASGVTEACR